MSTDLKWQRSGPYTWRLYSTNRVPSNFQRVAGFIGQLSPTRYEGCSYVNHEWMYASTLAELFAAIETTHHLLNGEQRTRFLLGIPTSRNNRRNK